MRRDSKGKYHETRVRVRFSEVDAYRIAWHGHYVAWMEEGRNDLAGRFGIDAAQVESCGYHLPVVSLELKFLRPARFGEELKVRTSITRSATATLQFPCEIVGVDGKVCASGRTIHALTDREGTLQYTFPPTVAARLWALYQHLGV